MKSSLTIGFTRYSLRSWGKCNKLLIDSIISRPPNSSLWSVTHQQWVIRAFVWKFNVATHELRRWFTRVSAKEVWELYTLWFDFIHVNPQMHMDVRNNPHICELCYIRRYVFSSPSLWRDQRIKWATGWRNKRRLVCILCNANIMRASREFWNSSHQFVVECSTTWWEFFKKLNWSMSTILSI